MSMVQDIGQGQQDTLTPEIRELKARLDALESRMERNEAAAERRHSEVLNTIRDAMEIIHLHVSMKTHSAIMLAITYIVLFNR